jgi:thioredoxin-like negative regulator of GroEL
MQLEQVERFDPTLGLIVRGRSALYKGNLKEARDLLSQAQRLMPGMREALLLEAEIRIQEKRVEEARTTLLTLAADPDSPDWVRGMAETLMKSIQ